MSYFLFVELSILIFLFAAVRHAWIRALSILHIFQQKGYKTYEFRPYLWQSGLSLFVTKAHLFVVPLFLLGLLEARLTITAYVLLISVFGAGFFLPVGYLTPDQQKKPLAFTPRMKRLSATTALLYILIAGTGLYLGMKFRILLPDVTIIALFLVMADMLIPFCVLLAAYLMKPVERKIQNGFIKQAQQKIASLPGLQIIGITGSYGKTSVKFMLKTLLEQRFSVCYTPGSFNTPMGICKVINNDLQSHHQILILEMGARYKGNIAELCGIAAPDIALITNVGKAHLETFGSVEGIAETKSEILSGLKNGGIAVLNTDDPIVAGMKIRSDVKLVKGGMENGPFMVSEIQYSRHGCSFTISTDKETARLETKLLGEHTIRNLILSMAAGLTLGLRLQTMVYAASQIEPVEHRLELKPAGKITYIDDAFNSNPVGARNAIDLLSRFEGGRRILITPGMVELGELEEQENRSWGLHIGKSRVDHVYLVGAERTKPIYEGLTEAGYDKSKISVCNSFFEARDLMLSRAEEGDVVLLENDLPDVYNEK